MKVPSYENVIASIHNCKHEDQQFVEISYISIRNRDKFRGKNKIGNVGSNCMLIQICGFLNWNSCWIREYKNTLLYTNKVIKRLLLESNFRCIMFLDLRTYRNWISGSRFLQEDYMMRNSFAGNIVKDQQCIVLQSWQ